MTDLKIEMLAQMTSLPVTRELKTVPSVVVEDVGDLTRLILFALSGRTEFDDVSNEEYVPGWEIEEIVESYDAESAMEFLLTGVPHLAA